MSDPSSSSTECSFTEEGNISIQTDFEYLDLHGETVNVGSDVGQLSYVPTRLTKNADNLPSDSKASHRREQCEDWGQDAQAQGNACRLRVDRQAPFIIKHADENWLLMFGFSRAEITGRALRVCQGPDTARQHMTELISGPGGVLDSVTLYSKAGDDKRVRICATPVHSVDGSGACLLEMYDVGTPLQIAVPSNEAPTAVLSATAPYRVEHVNSTFLSFFGYTMPQVLAQGIGIIFGRNTDRYQWQLLLQAGAAGNAQAGQLLTLSAETELPTAVQVEPIRDATDGVCSLAVTFGEQGSLVFNQNRRRSAAAAEAQQPGAEEAPQERDEMSLAGGEEFSRPSSSGSSQSRRSSGRDSSPSPSRIGEPGRKLDFIDHVKFHLDALKGMRHQRLCS